MNYLYVLIIITIWYWFFAILKLDFKVSFQLKKTDNAQLLIRSLIIGDYSKRQLPKYKYFTEIIEQLLEYRNKYGAKIESSLREFKGHIQKEKKFDQKISDSLKSGITQYLFISLFTWFFLFYAKTMIDVSLNKIELICLLLWQFFGLLFYISVFEILKKHSLSPFSILIECVYKFKTLVSFSRSVNQIRDEVLPKGYTFKGDLLLVFEKIELILQKMLTKGKYRPDELDGVIIETWDLLEINLERFEKKMNLLKFFILALFVLPSYLVTVISTLNQLH